MLIGTRAIAEAVHISPGRVKALAESGELPARFVNGRWRANEEDLDRFLGRKPDNREIDEFIGYLKGFIAQTQAFLRALEGMREG